MSEDYIEHVGVKRRSGRYPWGSGEDPYQTADSWLGYVYELRKSGMSEKDIYESMNLNSAQFRARITIAKEEVVRERRERVEQLHRKQMSNTAIAESLGISEGTVRNYLKPIEEAKRDRTMRTADALEAALKENPYLDVGSGVPEHLNISETRLKAALEVLKERGYEVTNIYPDNVATDGLEKVTVKVLSKNGVKPQELYNNMDQISMPGLYEDQGVIRKSEPPRSISSSKVAVRYGPDGGAEKDGLIEIRPGVDELSLGSKSYAQVRVAVDGTHYLKGMAIYSDDVPKGYDVIFNTNKDKGKTKLDALKPMEDDEDLPFKSSVQPRYFTDKKGERHRSAINVVNEEGTWDDWNRNLPSQFLSKQPLSLAKKQLGIAIQQKINDFEEIESLTNPSIKRKMLESFSDDCDSAAVNLKAASLPRQRTQVILPVPSMKDTEVYAPNFKNGERVVLVRFPHAGTFEIPELTVNNNNAKAKKALGKVKDAVGISAKVARKLSGADFDGDTVLVIPNNDGRIKSSKALKGLANFDPSIDYKAYPGMKKVKDDKGFNKQLEMGKVSNLITDMQIKMASEADVAAAVRHSMVVIDAEKHDLDWRRSAKENRISQLKQKYQGGANKGASTLVSKASSEVQVTRRKPRRASDGGPIDPKTGEKRYTEIHKPRYKKNAAGEWVPDGWKTQPSTKMAETSDARTLSSGTPMEEAYATYANSMKALANRSRKAMYSVKDIKYSPAANKKYAKEVAELKSAVDLARKNAPLERRAQMLANSAIKLRRAANPDMDSEALKKVRGAELKKARDISGASKQRIVITDGQWKAIQDGAISSTMMDAVVANSDLEKLKERATPRNKPAMSSSKIARATTMMKSGRYTRAEIADALGVSVDTLNGNLEGK